MYLLKYFPIVNNSNFVLFYFFFLFCLKSVTKMTGVRYAQDMQQMMRRLQILYKAQIGSDSPERAEYFRKFALFTEILFIGIVVGYYACGICFLAYPIIMYLAKAEMVPALPIYLPFVDENTITGYTILTIYHIILIILPSTGLAGVEFFLATFMISSLIFAKLITLDAQQLNIDLSAEKPKNTVIKCRLRNILLMHKEMGE